MVGDGYYGRLVRKLPYYRTQPHRDDGAGLGFVASGQLGTQYPSTGVCRRRHETAGMPIGHPGRS